MPSSSIPLRGLRRPRLLATVDGVPVADAVSARVLSRGYPAADRFVLVAALGDSAPGDWLAGGRMAVAIAVALDGAATTLIEGEADQLELDPIRRTATLTGRDLAARLIEARTQESFANRTASEIATLLAQRRGLEADVARTATPVGRYWQPQRDRLALDRFGGATTEWDLLAALAALEGFDLWVAGRRLHFRPRDAAAAAVATLRAAPGPLGAANVAGLRLERSLGLARGIEVVVRSWNARRQQAVLGHARRGGTGAPQRYIFAVPNLSPEEAQALARQRLEELARHERRIAAEMPGETALAPRQRIRLDGTGTDFDRDYVIDEIDRSLHPGHGFTQTLRARAAA